MEWAPGNSALSLVLLAQLAGSGERSSTSHNDLSWSCLPPACPPLPFSSPLSRDDVAHSALGEMLLYPILFLVGSFSSVQCSTAVFQTLHEMLRVNGGSQFRK